MSPLITAQPHHAIGVASVFREKTEAPRAQRTQSPTHWLTNKIWLLSQVLGWLSLIPDTERKATGRECHWGPGEGAGQASTSCEEVVVSPGQGTCPVVVQFWGHTREAAVDLGCRG